MNINQINSHESNALLSNEKAIFAGHELGKVLGTGSYSFVREAVHIASNQSRAIKFAKAKAQADSGCAQTGCFLSRPLTQMTGSYGEVSLSSREFLAKQYERFMGIACDGWLKIHEMIDAEGQTAAVMNLSTGRPLRQFIQEGKTDLDPVKKAVSALASLEKTSSSIKHGDIKPENILVEANQCFLIDPGYSGQLICEHNQELSVCMTTPDYYPFLDQNDQSALGLILFEVITGRNPTAFSPAQTGTEPTLKISTALRQTIETQRLGNNYFPARLYSLPAYLDYFRDKLPENLASISLKCLGIKITDQKELECCEQFAGAVELERALSRF